MTLNWLRKRLVVRCCREQIKFIAEQSSRRKWSELNFLSHLLIGCHWETGACRLEWRKFEFKFFTTSTLGSSFVRASLSLSSPHPSANTIELLSSLVSGNRKGGTNNHAQASSTSLRRINCRAGKSIPSRGRANFRSTGRNQRKRQRDGSVK